MYGRLIAAARRRPLVYLLFHVCISTGLAYLLMCLIFPDLFVKTNISFIRFADTEINFYGTFTLVSNLFHGGIQLWDPYNQMPLAYFYTAVSMLSFSTLWTAFAYSMFAPFVEYPGQFFHVLYSRFYYVPAMLILCAGSLLLFRRFTKNPLQLIFLTMFCESMLLPQMYLGLNTESLFSFFPLLIHFVLSFFERGRFRDAVCALLMFAVCVGMFPLIAIGYFYQGVHFVVLPIIVWWIVTKKRAIFSKTGIQTAGRGIWAVLSNLRSMTILLVSGLLVLFLLLPHIMIVQTTYKDYDIAHENSRFSNYNPLRFSDYFRRASQYAAMSDLAPKLLTFTDNQWALSWVFIGTLAVFLVLCGMVLSVDGRKYIFGSAVLCYWLLNSPRVTTGWQSGIHWINAITNPFNVAVRSMHMTGALMLSLVLAPLIAMGLVALLFPPKESQRRLLVKTCIVLFLLVLVVESALMVLPPEHYWFLIVGMICSSGILFSRMIRFPRHDIVIGILLFILFVSDAYAMSHYLRLVSRQMNVQPHQISVGSLTSFLDYQNPLILPLRWFYSVRDIHVRPYLAANPHNSREQFLRFTNYGIYFSRPDQYHARHKEYTRIAHDSVFRKYLRTNDQVIFQANLAVPEQDGMFARILEQKQERNIIVVDRDPHIPGLYQRDLPQQQMPEEEVPQLPVKTRTFSLNISESRPQDDLVLYHLPLPDDFPAHVASTVFTRDSQMLSVKLGERELTPGQGWLVHPYTYDIQNVQTRKLTIAVPVSTKESDITLSYAVPGEEGMQTVSVYRPDHLRFDYQTKSDGWLVFHSPYDPKWKLMLDGKVAEMYRANYSFIGIPLTAGKHTIDLKYWPDTWLRPLLAITMALVMTMPFALIWIGAKDLRQEKKNRLVTVAIS